MLDPDVTTLLPMNATNIHSAVFTQKATLDILRLLLMGRDRELLNSGPA
jgi:hypothetical protein